MVRRQSTVSCVDKEDTGRRSTYEPQHPRQKQQCGEQKAANSRTAKIWTVPQGPPLALSVFSYLYPSLFPWVLLCCIIFLWIYVEKCLAFWLLDKNFCWGKDTDADAPDSTLCLTQRQVSAEQQNQRDLSASTLESMENHLHPPRAGPNPRECPHVLFSLKGSEVLDDFVKLVLAAEPLSSLQPHVCDGADEGFGGQFER